MSFIQKYLHKLSARYNFAQHSTAQHSTAQHSTAQHNTAQHSTYNIVTPHARSIILFKQ